MKKMIVMALISLVLSILVCVWLFSQVRLSEFKNSLQDFNAIEITLFVLINIVLQLLRVWRFESLLDKNKTISFNQLFSIVNISMMAVFLLPLRLGEFVRPYLLKKKLSMTFGEGLASVATERIIDGLVVLFGFFIVTQISPDISQRIRHVGFVAFLFFASVAIVLLLMLWKQPFFERVVAFFLGRYFKSLYTRVIELSRAIIQGLKPILKLHQLFRYTWLTCVIWGITAIATQLLCHAIHVSISFTEAYVILTLTVVSVMLPAGPMTLGPFHAAVVMGLQLFKIAKAPALACAFLLHGLPALITLLFGFYSLLKSHLSLSYLIQDSQKEAHIKT